MNRVGESAPFTTLRRTAGLHGKKPGIFAPLSAWTLHGSETLRGYRIEHFTGTIKYQEIFDHPDLYRFDHQTQVFLRFIQAWC